MTFIISFLLFCFSQIACSMGKAGVLFIPLFHSCAACFPGVYNHVFYWVSGSGGMSHTPPPQGEEAAGRPIRMFPSPPLSAGMRSAPWAVIYRLSISMSPQGAERSPAFPHFNSSWVLELAEMGVSSWEDSVLFQGGPGFCQP